MDLSYNLDEQQASVIEQNQPFLKKFTKSFGALANPHIKVLTERNSTTLVGFIAANFANEWERIVLTSQFNAWGAVRLESDVRGVTSIMVSNEWAGRDKLVRISQMALILNTSTFDEILEFWGTNAGPIVWRLTGPQVKKVLNQR